MNWSDLIAAVIAVGGQVEFKALRGPPDGDIHVVAQRDDLQLICRAQPSVEAFATSAECFMTYLTMQGFFA